MGRPRKLQKLGDVAAVIAAAPNLTKAAQQLGVDRSTVHKWIREGKVPRPAPRPRRVATLPRAKSPKGWATWVRRTYALDETERALVVMAEQAFALACDQKARPETRLAAMGRFQRLVTQLDLEGIDDGEVETTGDEEEATAADVRRWPHPVRRDA